MHQMNAQIGFSGGERDLPPSIILCLSFGLFIFLLSTTLFAQTIYLRPEEALKTIFHDSQEVILEKKVLMPHQEDSLERHFGIKVTKKEWNFYIAQSGQRVDGYALIDHEVGKTEPITFLTAITPTGSVKAVEILVYREPIGSEVHDARFLKQYQGKQAKDPIRVGQDIANISGATLSARAVSQGVKRSLALWKVFYSKEFP